MHEVTLPSYRSWIPGSATAQMWTHCEEKRLSQLASASMALAQRRYPHMSSSSLLSTQALSPGPTRPSIAQGSTSLEWETHDEPRGSGAANHKMCICPPFWGLSISGERTRELWLEHAPFSKRPQSRWSKAPTLTPASPRSSALPRGTTKGLS